MLDDNDDTSRKMQSATSNALDMLDPKMHAIDALPNSMKQDAVSVLVLELACAISIVGTRFLNNDADAAEGFGSSVGGMVTETMKVMHRAVKGDTAPNEEDPWA